MAIAFSSLLECLPIPGGNSLIHLNVPLCISVQKVSTSHISLLRSLCRGVLHGQLYGLCFSGLHILLYVVDCLRMYVYTSYPRISSSLEMRALRCWCPPPSFHNMHCNIAYAQLGVRLELSSRRLFECHMCVYMLVLAAYRIHALL